MAKRARDDDIVTEGDDELALKRVRLEMTDRLSQLSDELLLKILKLLPVPSLALCQRVSHRFYCLASDPHLWKAAYYTRFVRPRVAMIPKIQDSATSTPTQSHTSNKSTWLGEDYLLKGIDTNWKRQYKLRHNWTKGNCHISEILLSEHCPKPPLLAQLKHGTVFTVDSANGLRAWPLKKNPGLRGTISVRDPNSGIERRPTFIAVGSRIHENDGIVRILVGFENAIFDFYDYFLEPGTFTHTFSMKAPYSENTLSAAYCHPYILTITQACLVSLYEIPISPHGVQPKLLATLDSQTIGHPMSLSINVTSSSIKASVAYTFASSFTGWAVGVQEIILTSSGTVVESRVASASDPSGVHVPVIGYGASMTAHGTCPTSLSYSHPYLLLSHADNTLTHYLVSSTPQSLSIGPGRRLWGHTSSISAVHIGNRGKAVSISSRGEELRVWELEDLALPVTSRRRPWKQHVTSVTVRRNAPTTVNEKHDFRFVGKSIPREKSTEIPRDESNLLLPMLSDYPFIHGIPLPEFQVTGSMPVVDGFVGFDEEQVVLVHKQMPMGVQVMRVYDFR